MVGSFVGRTASNVDLFGLDGLEASAVNPVQASDFLEVTILGLCVVNGFEALSILVAELCTCRGGSDVPRHLWRRSSEVSCRTYSVPDAFFTSKDCVCAGARIKSISRLEKNGCRKHCKKILDLHPECQYRVQRLEKPSEFGAPTSYIRLTSGLPIQYSNAAITRPEQWLVVRHGTEGLLTKLPNGQRKNENGTARE